jgi:hypothetical protein
MSNPCKVELGLMVSIVNGQQRSKAKSRSLFNREPKTVFDGT